MSDISFGPGFGVVVGGSYALVVGAVLLILAVLAGTIFVRHGTWKARAFRFVAGPLTCIGLTILYLVVADFLDHRSLVWLSEQYKIVPVVACGIALVTMLGYEFVRRRKSVRAPELDRAK